MYHFINAGANKIKARRRGTVPNHQQAEQDAASASGIIQSPIPPEVAAFYIRLPLGRRGVGDKVRALSFVYELVILAVPNLNDVVEVLARRWELK